MIRRSSSVLLSALSLMGATSLAYGQARYVIPSVSFRDPLATTPFTGAPNTNNAAYTAVLSTTFALSASVSQLGGTITRTNTSTLVSELGFRITNSAYAACWMDFGLTGAVTANTAALTSSTRTGTGPMIGALMSNGSTIRFEAYCSTTTGATIGAAEATGTNVDFQMNATAYTATTAETFTFSGPTAVGFGSSTTTSSFTSTSAGGYVLVANTFTNSISFTNILATGTFRSDVKISASNNGYPGLTFVFTPWNHSGSLGTGTTLTQYSGIGGSGTGTLLNSSIASGSTWTFNIYDSTDDSPTGTDETISNLSFSLSQLTFPATAFDSGTLAGPYNSGGTVYSADNSTIALGTVGADFVMGQSHVFQGVGSNALTSNVASDLRVRIRNSAYPSYWTMELQPTTGSFSSSTISVLNTAVVSPTAPSGFSNRQASTLRGLNMPAGSTFTAELYDINDNGAGADSTWTNVRIRFTSGTAWGPSGTPPTDFTDLGTITSANSTTATALSGVSSAIGPNQYKWFRLVVPANVAGSAGSYLHIYTTAPTNGPTDTLLNIFDNSGRHLIYDDDSGSANLSMLTIGAPGATTPYTVSGTSDGPFNGKDAGGLPAGIYWIAVAGFSSNDSFGDGFIATTTNTSTFTGGTRVNVISNVPWTNTAPSLATIGAQSVNEQSNLTFNALGSDVDFPAQTLAYSLSGAPSGASINPTTGVFNWTPTEVQGPGPYTFSVQVSDGFSTTSQSVSVTVNEVNLAPTWATIPAQSGSEDTAFSLNVAPFASDSDIPLNTLSYSLVSGPTGLTVSSGGAVDWTPGEADGGTAPTVTVRVTDDGSPTLFADRTFTINVAETNSAPTLAPIGSQTIDELQTLALVAVGSDTDDPAQTLTYGLVGAPTGATINTGSGAFSWTPAENQGPGSFTFDVTVTDGVSTASETITVTVNEVNVTPVWNSIVAQSATEDVLFSLNVAPFASDSDTLPIVQNNLTFTKQSGPTALSVSSAGLVTWTPGELDGGTSPTVTVRVTDDGAPTLFAEVTFTINVAEANQAPIWATIPAQSASEHAGFSMSLSTFASDADDPANALTYTLLSGPSGLTVSGAGMVDWTPGETDGGTSPSVQVRVTDNGNPNLTADKTFTINVAEVNAAPALVAIPNQTVAPTNPLTFTAIGSDPNDTPANSLTYSLVAGPDPVPAGASIDPISGVFSWTPTISQGPAVYDFKVRVTDDGINPSGLFAEQPVHIVVDVSNVAPTANNASFSTNENTAVNTPVVATDPDLPAQTLSYTIVTGPTHGLLSGSAPNYVYTPFNHYAGPDSFTYKVNDGQADSNVATVSLTVNDTIPMSVQVAGTPAPNAFGSPSWAGYRANALTSLETTFGADFGSRLIDPTAYDVVTTIPWYDNTATGWAFWMGNLNPVVPFDQELGHRLHFGVRVLGNGTRFSLSELTFDMDSSDPGNDLNFDGSFDGNDPSYPFPDFYGPSRRGIDYGPDRVKGTTDDIIYNTDATPAETEVDELIYVGIGNAWDATQEPGATPAQKTESLRCYLEGLLSVAPINISTTYKIRDGGYNGPVLATGTGTVTMVPTNVLPTANSQTVTVAEDGSVGITLVANDPDDATLTYTVVAGPTHGMLSGTGANRIYTPNANYSGPDSFTFKATDCVGDSNIATVTINVTPVNDDPILGAIGDQTIDEMAPYSITLGSTDIDGGAPVYSGTSLPAGASISGNVFNWTPTEAQGPGSYTMTIQVSDGAGGTDSETITITVSEVNVAPTLEAISNQTVDELTLVTFDADGADSDLPANTLTYSLIGAPSGATINPATGEFTWTPTEPQGGQAYPFTVRISDGTLNADRGVTITVNEVNSAPTLNTISNQTVNELTPVTFTATASDTDDPANTLTFSLIGAPSGASINPATGAFTWTPTEAQGPNSYTFTVRVTDDGVAPLHTDQSVTIDVAEVNVPPVAIGQTLGTRVNTPLNITLLATDSDLPANTLTYMVVGSPTHGTLSVSGANVVYTPNTNYTGPDSFTFKANDGLANSNIETVNINVSGTTITLNLQLQGFSAVGPSTRGMTMFLGGTTGGANPPVNVSRDVVFSATGQAQIVFVAADGFLPTDDLSTYGITVKDDLHSLRKRVGLTWDGSNYVASVTLISGNINRDNRVDIGDYVVYAVQYGNLQSQDTPFSLHTNPVFRHADLSGDRAVDTADFSFISTAWGQIDENVIGNYGRGNVQIRTRISVADAMIEAGREAARLDRNRDGWISLEEATQQLR